MKTNPYRMIVTTCASVEEAQRLARLLVEEGAAACIQITGVTSIYRWKEAVVQDEEQMLIIKTRAALYAKVEKLIIGMHSYEVPEIIEIDISRGFEKYLRWIDSSTHD